MPGPPFKCGVLTSKWNSLKEKEEEDHLRVTQLRLILTDNCGLCQFKQCFLWILELDGENRTCKACNKFGQEFSWPLLNIHGTNSVPRHQYRRRQATTLVIQSVLEIELVDLEDPV